MLLLYCCGGIEKGFLWSFWVCVCCLDGVCFGEIGVICVVVYMCWS